MSDIPQPTEQPSEESKQAPAANESPQEKPGKALSDTPEPKEQPSEESKQPPAASESPQEKPAGKPVAKDSPKDKPAAKAKPPKPEDKPFPEFIDTLFIPAVEKQLEDNAIKPERLERITESRPVVGGDCSMVVGVLPGGRRFWVCFAKENINSPKHIALAEPGSEPTLLESFLIDEKRMTLALLVSRLLQRLNGQKWLGRN